MFVLVLFGHVVGVLILFAAFALEWAVLHEMRRPAGGDAGQPRVEFARVLPRLSVTAALLLLLSGGYMASQLSVWHTGWIAISLATLVILAVVGRTSGARMRAALGRVSNDEPDAREIVRRSTRDRWLTASFRLRVSAMLGVVYLMVAKPDLVPSMIIIITFALAGAASTFRMWQAPRGARGERRPAEKAGALAEGKV